MSNVQDDRQIVQSTRARGFNEFWSIGVGFSPGGCVICPNWAPHVAGSRDRSSECRADLFGPVTAVTGFPLGESQHENMMCTANTLLDLPIVVPHETTLELYRKMLTAMFVEERMKIFVKQGKCSFLASTRGHEKVQIGMTMLLRPGSTRPRTCYRAVLRGAY
jgi:hypothetical protein